MQVASDMSQLEGGGQLGEAVLSRDGQLLFAAVADSARAFSTATGEWLFTLQHAAQVTALCLHPSDGSLLYSGSADGCITLWDLATASQCRRWQLDAPLQSLVVSSTWAYVTCTWRQSQAARLLAYDLAKHAASAGRIRLSRPGRLVASPDGRLFATVDRNTAMVWDRVRFPHDPLVLTHTKALTCTALSADGEVLAAGDATGRIVCWRGVSSALGLSTSAERPACPQTTVHWHAGAVRCLCFSSDGLYLLSGGSEGVLVMWELSSSRRAYLPRLGRCLTSIACCDDDPSSVAVVLEENVVRMVDVAAMLVRHSISGVCCQRLPAAGTCVQPGTANLVRAGEGGTLQFFDLQRDVHVGSLQLSCAAGSPGSPRPTHAMFRGDGEVLITVEERAGGAGQARSVIRAWHRTEPFAHSYASDSSIANCWSVPDTVKAVAVNPRRVQVAAVLGAGGVCCQDVGPLRAAHETAAQRHQGGRFEATALAFSTDGTVLAVGSTAHEPVLLMDSAAERIVQRLPPAVCGGQQGTAPLQRLVFLSDGRRLAAQWEGGVAVYDVTKCRLELAGCLAAAVLAADPRSARFAVGSPGGGVLHVGGDGTPGGAMCVARRRGVEAALYVERRSGASQGVPVPSDLLVLNDALQFASVGSSGATRATVGFRHLPEAHVSEPAERRPAPAHPAPAELCASGLERLVM